MKQNKLVNGFLSGILALGGCGSGFDANTDNLPADSLIGGRHLTIHEGDLELLKQLKTSKDPKDLELAQNPEFINLLEDNLSVEIRSWCPDKSVVFNAEAITSEDNQASPFNVITTSTGNGNFPINLEDNANSYKNGAFYTVKLVGGVEGRKITQIGNLVVSYEGGHSDRVQDFFINRLGTKVENVEARLDNVTNRVDNLETIVDNITTPVDNDNDTTIPPVDNVTYPTDLAILLGKTHAEFSSHPITDYCATISLYMPKELEQRLKTLPPKFLVEEKGYPAVGGDILKGYPGIDVSKFSQPYLVSDNGTDVVYRATVDFSRNPAYPGIELLQGDYRLDVGTGEIGINDSTEVHLP